MRLVRHAVLQEGLELGAFFCAPVSGDAGRNTPPGQPASQVSKLRASARKRAGPHGWRGRACFCTALRVSPAPLWCSMLVHHSILVH
ncbi:hypothetical protein CSB93_0674 [Pseudomonas paraeruginosa]|uniref:Uncharacterized protein n=1 Tax=Pseudomonas paraeruginosa TaxID=2994495 RepID=A0A2R3ISF8_9PSED|nr:hypothetical protein CSB93_0674 [Pseudomonas paraeruginosa]AWE94801.1 hypothetical protein CSC28_5987 [Pseudomonas paraeruginosa]PTC34310.1 hypothetical protein CLJ1_5518 [Pseudomonas aeruginosa]